MLSNSYFAWNRTFQVSTDFFVPCVGKIEKMQAMMKDPFGNYVVQKVLETCDDQSLELLLSRIKVHLNVLKKYTYGKHIVSRIEKLIATGGDKHLNLFVVFIYFLMATTKS